MLPLIIAIALVIAAAAVFVEQFVLSLTGTSLPPAAAATLFALNLVGFFLIALCISAIRTGVLHARVPIERDQRPVVFVVGLCTYLTVGVAFLAGVVGVLWTIAAR